MHTRHTCGTGNIFISIIQKKTQSFTLNVLLSPFGSIRCLMERSFIDNEKNLRIHLNCSATCIVYRFVLTSHSKIITNDFIPFVCLILASDDKCPFFSCWKIRIINTTAVSQLFIYFLLNNLNIWIFLFKFVRKKFYRTAKLFVYMYLYIFYV